MNQELSVSNSRLTLTLPAHSASTFTPGCLLLPKLTFKGSPNYSSLTITLIGITLSRLLVGTLSYVVNDPLVTTNMEKDVFLNLQASHLSNPSAEVDRKTSAASTSDIKGGIYELRIPRNLGVLPSLKMFDYSGKSRFHMA